MKSAHDVAHEWAEADERERERLRALGFVEEPRRLTPSERLHELAMAHATRPTSPPESSCDLTRNAKGDVQVGVTVRGYDAGEVVAEAQRLFDGLCVAYPRSEAPAGGGSA